MKYMGYKLVMLSALEDTIVYDLVPAVNLELMFLLSNLYQIGTI